MFSSKIEPLSFYIRKVGKLRTWLIFLGILFILVSALDINVLFAKSQAQTDEGETHTQVWNHTNLSRSGSATEPQMVVDVNDVIHVVWREENVDSFFYTRQEDGEWIKPVSIEFPFGTRRFLPNLRRSEPTPLYDPYLLADKNGRVHAFWLDENKTLFSSFVLAEQIENFEFWSKIIQLDTSIIDFDVTCDEENNIHLTYIRDTDRAEAPAGIYYRKLDGQELAWYFAKPLYTSAYYRNLDPIQANLDIATTGSFVTNMELGEENIGGNVDIWIAADNRPVEQVFSLSSQDNGENWDEPTFVDERRIEDSESAVGPSRISVTTVGDEIHFIWLAGHETNCAQYHQKSVNRGATWEMPVIVSPNQENCPDKYETFIGENGLLVLLNYVVGQAYLQVWNGEEWSEPEIQPEITGFIDPVTQRHVNLACQQTAVTDDNKVIVVGCGTGNVNDIWFLERPLADEAAWFPVQEALVWQSPELLFESNERHIKSPLLINVEDTIHAFWLSDNKNDAEETHAEIYHTQWDGLSWARIVPLLSLSSPLVDQLQGGIDENGNLSLIWRNSETNNFHLKQVNEQNVRNPADWSDRREFVDANSFITKPALQFNEAGVSHSVMATPLNEKRGLYWIQTEASRDSWTDPILIFDAAAAGWAMVDNPSLAQTTAGDLHVIMTQYDLYPEPQAKSLHYMSFREVDGTWLSPEIIAVGDIGWSEIVSLDERVVLIMWQQFEDEENRILFQQSLDNGRSWEGPFVFLNFATNELFHPAMVRDESNNQLHLIYVVNENGEDASFHEHLWQNGRWQVGETYPLFGDINEKFNDLAAAKMPSGQFVLLNSFTENLHEDAEIADHLYFSQRLYETPEDSSLPQPVQGLLVENEFAVATPIQPQQTPPVLALLDESPSQSEFSTAPLNTPNAPITEILIGLAPVVLFVGCVIAFSLLRFRYRGRR